MNQSGEAETVNEFNRCFYDKPIDFDRFSVMANFD